MSKNSRKIYFRLQTYEKWAKKYDTILPIIHTNLIYELFLNEFLAILNNNTLTEPTLKSKTCLKSSNY